MNWQIEVSGQRITLRDMAHLDEILQSLHSSSKHTPMIVHLLAPDDATLNVGVGADESVLNFIAPGGWPAWHSVGNVEYEDDEASGVIVYRVADEPTEFPRRWAVPLPLALAAARDFYMTSSKSERLTWEEE